MSIISNRAIRLQSIESNKSSLFTTENNRKFYKTFGTKVVLVDKDPLSSLLKDPLSNNYHSDVWLLTQKERLSALSAENLSQLVSTRFSKRKSSNRGENVTDEILFDAIVSRRLDSPSERMAYLNYIENMIGQKSEVIREILEEQNSVSSVETPSDETIKTDKTD